MDDAIISNKVMVLVTMIMTVIVDVTGAKMNDNEILMIMKKMHCTDNDDDDDELIIIIIIIKRN